MDRISDIAAFVQVAEQGSFTAAAEALGLSKAAVSKYVRRLEKRLATRLLNRTTRRVALTESGQALFDRASVAIADLAAAENDVLELAGSPRGRLRVSAPFCLGEAFLVPRLAAFRARYPDIALDLDLDNREVDGVEEAFDVAIRLSPPGPGSLPVRKLADVRVVTAASPAYLERQGTPSSPMELREHECLLDGFGGTPGEWRFRRGLDRLISMRVQGAFRCNNDGALKRAALDGLGILRAPQIFIERELHDGSLVAILQDFEMQKLVLSAAFPTCHPLPPKARVFVDFLAGQFRA